MVFILDVSVLHKDVLDAIGGSLGGVKNDSGGPVGVKHVFIAKIGTLHLEAVLGPTVGGVGGAKVLKKGYDGLAVGTESVVVAMAFVMLALVLAGLFLMAALLVTGEALAGDSLRSLVGTRLVDLLLVVVGAILVVVFGLLSHGGSAHEGCSKGEYKNNFLHNELIVTFFYVLKIGCKNRNIFLLGQNIFKKRGVF